MNPAPPVMSALRTGGGVYRRAYCATDLPFQTAPAKTAETPVPRGLRATERRSRLLGVRPLSWLEDATVVALAALATLHAEWRILANSLVFQTDAQIHEYWMRRFQDPALFDDPLTNALLDTGYSPAGFRLLYWLASHVVDPVLFGELLPLVLQPLAVWLVFRIVRDHVAWRPAAWIAAALFLVPWEIHRFSGGHPRAFAQPIVLLAVFLLLRRRNLAAALVPAVGLLLYPPAALVALAIVVLAALERKQRFFVDRTRAAWAGAGVAGFAVVALTTRLVSGYHPLVSEEEARRYPEFGPDGQMHFFLDSTLDFLTQNYSGFFLGAPGSLLAVAALFLLVVRPRNATLLRWEVWCMPVAALALFAAAHALLFRLYLPHRYTYSLLPFFCIVIGVALRPTLEAWAARARLWLLAAAALPLALALLALTVFPLGPQLSWSRFGSWLEDARWHLVAGLLVGLLLAALLAGRAEHRRRLGAGAAAAALVAGTLLAAEVTFAGGGESPGAAACRDDGLYRYLRTLPEDTIVAGEPSRLNCVPIAARRPVLISTKLYQPWEREFLAIIRDRMFSTVDALYGSSVAAVVDLRDRYGADYLLVRSSPSVRAWRGLAPFTGEVRRLLRADHVPAAQRLPARCEVWGSGSFTLYGLACVASEARR
jgi:hypothetical protein